MKNFDNELVKLYDKLKSKEPFSFSKFADGEWMMIKGVPVNNGEFNFTNEDEFYRQRLIESFKYKDDGYYVGISCPCCQGNDFYAMKQFSEQDEKQLTFANIFVNNNYSKYVDLFIPEYNNWDIHLVANKNAKINDLPFKIEKFYAVENSAWKLNYSLIDEINDLNLKGKLFLFACGPFGNMLAHQLWKNNKNNTYLDIGSTLNPWLKSEGFKRDYYNNGVSYKDKICIWG